MMPRPSASVAPRPSSAIEVLDLRHFAAAQLRPLLRDEAAHWEQRLRWEYTRSTELLLEYLDGRVLPGFVAMQSGRIVGYTFCVFEAAKAVVGDAYALGEAQSGHNPVCETLLHHLLEMLQATPAVDRVESQLLLFPAGALQTPFGSRGFRAYPRLFMTWDFAGPGCTAPLAHRPAATFPRGLRLEAWSSDLYQTAAECIHRCYAGHMDGDINDQYRSLSGSLRFLHNIVRFPGCGVFDADNSWVLRDTASGAVQAMLLSSRVHTGVAHITQLCVAPGFRGLGLGKLLLERCAAEIAARSGTTLSLTVTEANSPAVSLYESLGFRTTHRFDAMVWSDPQA